MRVCESRRVGEYLSLTKIQCALLRMSLRKANREAQAVCQPLKSGNRNSRMGVYARERISETDFKRRRLAHEEGDCGLLSADLAAGIQRIVSTEFLFVHPQARGCSFHTSSLTCISQRPKAFNVGWRQRKTRLRSPTHIHAA